MNVTTFVAALLLLSTKAIKNNNICTMAEGKRRKFHKKGDVTYSIEIILIHRTFMTILSVKNNNINWDKLLNNN